MKGFWGLDNSILTFHLREGHNKSGHVAMAIIKGVMNTYFGEFVAVIIK